MSLQVGTGSAVETNEEAGLEECRITGLCHSCTGEGGCRLLWRWFHLLSSAFYPLFPLFVPLVLTPPHAYLKDRSLVAAVCCFYFPIFWVDVAVLQVALAHALEAQGFRLWAWFSVPAHLLTCYASAEMKLWRSFSDGSKNVTIKMNWCIFQTSLRLFKWNSL